MVNCDLRLLCIPLKLDLERTSIDLLRKSVDQFPDSCLAVNTHDDMLGSLRSCDEVNEQNVLQDAVRLLKRAMRSDAGSTALFGSLEEFLEHIHRVFD